jgi:hypothetical protein
MARNRATDADSVGSSPVCVTSPYDAILLLNEALTQLGAPLKHDPTESGVSARRRLIETNIRLVRHFLETIGGISATVAMTEVAITEVARFVWLLFEALST